MADWPPIRIPPAAVKLANIFCGCAEAVTSYRPLIETLEKHDAQAWDGTAGLADHILDHLGMLEHGTSIRCSWLTEDGKEALAFFREHGDDWEDKGNRFKSDDDVWYGDVNK